MGLLKQALKLNPELKRPFWTSSDTLVDSPSKKRNLMSKIIEEHELEDLDSSHSSKGISKRKKDKRESKVSFVEESLESSSSDKKRSISSKSSDSDLKIKLVDESQRRQKDTTIVGTNTFMSSAFHDSKESETPVVGQGPSEKI